MFKSIAPISFALFISASLPAHATSGAELKDLDERFATGYVWGVLELWIVNEVGDSSEEIQQKNRRRECLIGANISAKTFYDATKTYMDSKPQLLAQPAFTAIIQTAIQICP